MVDDDESLRLIVRVALETSGRFRVVAEGATGEDAVALVAEHRPDLLLLDIAMPRMNGLEALPEVREASPETAVVILSGFEEARLGQRAREGGASAYVEKRTPPDRLVDHLLTVLGCQG